jgi:hypothetical protein
MHALFEIFAALRPGRPRHGFALALGCALIVGAASGCSVCQQARRTVCFEPLDFPLKLDRARSLKTYRRWAAEAWRTERAACPEAAASRDYATGFQDGFVDFLYAGGDGTPPPIPPRKYWNLAWRSPAGQVAANQWFAGFRHGAQVAHDGGYRQQAVVPSSFRAAERREWDAPDASSLAEPIEELGPPREDLPTPPASMAFPDLPSATPASPVSTPPLGGAAPRKDAAALQDFLPLDADASALPKGKAP